MRAQTSSFPATSSASREAVTGHRPRGLIDTLQEDGVLRQELVGRDGTYAVETRVFFDTEKAWLYRCAISRDGQEIVTPPWQPKLKNSTDSVHGQENTAALRLQLARSALECHLTQYRQVNSCLDANGTLTKKRRFRLPKVDAKIWRSLAILGVVLAAAWGLWNNRHALEASFKTPEATQGSAESPLGETQIASKDELGSPIQSLLEEPVGPLPSAAADNPWSPPAHPETTATTPRPAEPQRRQTRTAAPSATSLHSADRRPASAPPRQENPSVQKPSPSQSLGTGRAAETTSPPISDTPSSSTSSSDTSSWGTSRLGTSSADIASSPPVRPKVATPRTRFQQVAKDIQPDPYRVFSLRPGAIPYEDSSIRLAKITSLPAPLLCITTPGVRGDTDQGIFFRLTSSSTVYVAHHRKVKRSPGWLKDFAKSGDTWSALEVDSGQDVLYDVYRRDYPAGAIALGSNTGARKLTRSVRTVVSIKKLAMYWICVPDPAKGAAGDQ